MKIIGYFWIFSTIEMQLAFGECKMFPCGYVSCKLPSNVMDWIDKNADRMKHPDEIEKIGYDYQHTHDGGLFNEALLRMDETILLN